MKATARTVPVCLCLWLALLGPAVAGLWAGEVPAGAVERARAFAEELRATVGSPGLAAAVAVDGRVVWSEGFGLADLEHRVPVGPETRFRIGSVSKLFTAAAVARLVQEGKLDLDAPIQRYVPDFPVKDGGPITPRQLAGHLAGIRHYTPADFFRPPRAYANVGEGLAIFRDDPLVHPPGTKYLYSSYGYNLLGAVVEGAAGEGFWAAVRRLVLDPLGLRATAADLPHEIVEGRSGFYRRSGEALENERFVDNSSKWPSGGFLSTAEDLARFAAAHLRDDFLKPESREWMWTSQRTADGEETGVGLGWRIGTTEAGRRFLHHGGTIEGGRALLLLLPEDGVAVALLTNLSRARFAEDEALQLAEMFIGSPKSGPAKDH